MAFTILLAWIGMTDLKAAVGDDAAGLGPIGQAAVARPYERIVLLSDHDSKIANSYKHWLESKSKAVVDVKTAKLSGPTHFGDIYKSAVKVLDELIKEGAEPDRLVFHLSPGTPAMAAVWIILAKTRFPAELIESSKAGGVKTVSVPFDISAEFIPDLLRKPDEELIRLAQGETPDAPEFADILHQSSVMQTLIAKARKVAPRNVPVLIEGESGTGKELLAKAIHDSSLRRKRPFVPVNCGAIPAELVDSELFGHERGAFTGAGNKRVGYIESASGGTLFLDEIGELPLPAQVKLLRVLQEGEVRPVGATKLVKVDVRVISATNRVLLREVAEHRFREDLFHRLAVAILRVPALREREGDLSLLIGKLLDKINTDTVHQPGFQHKTISVAANNLLLKHSWPGNVRELLNTLQRAAIWSDGSRIEAADVQDAVLLPMNQPASVLNRSFGEGFAIHAIIDDVTRHYLERAMTEAQGNKTKAAELLGLSNYQTLTNWLKKYDL